MLVYAVSYDISKCVVVTPLRLSVWSTFFRIIMKNTLYFESISKSIIILSLRKSKIKWQTLHLIILTMTVLYVMH